MANLQTSSQPFNPHNRRTSAVILLVRFLRSSRGGATTLTAIAVTFMTIMGAALMVDHEWLVNKRDVLHSAAAAATIAATKQLRAMPRTEDDAAVKIALEKTAQRYVWFNLRPNIRDEPLSRGDVQVILDIDRVNGIVDVTVDAPIGRSLMGRIVGYLGPDALRARIGAEAGIGPVWAVLALDISSSMRSAVSGAFPRTPAEMRINVVKAAAKDFVATIHPGPDDQSGAVHVGIIPWHRMVGHVTRPTSVLAEINAAIDGLRANGSGTASSSGMREARELLEAAPDGARRVLVLLTDGQDNHGPNRRRCPEDQCPKHRAAECALAKADSVTVFTIGAMALTQAALAEQLRQCASSLEYAFTSHSSPQTMRDTFATIAGEMKKLRRIY